MKTRFMALMVLILAGDLISAHAQKAPFEVLGLHTGMTAQQAKAAITDKFGPAVFKAASIQRVRGVIPGHQFIAAIGLHTAKFELVVNFVEVPPALNLGSESAYSITYIPALPTVADKLAFKRQAIEKYGKPFDPNNVSESDVWQPLCWCNPNNALPRYAQCNPDINGGTPVLRIYSQVLGFGIQLRESSIYSRMTRALEASRTRSSPPL